MVLEIRRSEARKKAAGVADLLEKLAAADLIMKVDPTRADMGQDAASGPTGMAIAVPAVVAQEWGLVVFEVDRVVQVQADALADGLRVGARKAEDPTELVQMLSKVLVEADHLG